MALLLLFPSGAAYPELNDWVTDEANVLSDDEELEIWATSEALYKKTGAQIAVLLVDTTYPDDIVTYGVKTFEENGIGSEKNDDGVLIIVSVSERKWRIEVGYGLEGYLPDALISSLGRERLEPYLNVSDYYTGLYNISFEIALILWNDYMGDPPKEKNESFLSSVCTWWVWGGILVLLVVLVVATKGRALWWILMALSFGRIRGGGGGGFGGFGGGGSGGGGSGGRF